MPKAALPVLLVVGGNGFLGSAISKQAVGRGWRVISISQSGKAFASPAGHQPAWSQSPLISWHAASALDPSTYHSLAAKCTAAVHTVGILLEDEYKGKDAKPWDALGSLFQGVARERGWGGHPNPLNPHLHGKYERINRDSALAVARTFLSTRSSTASSPAPFIYISAEDIFRPFVPARYITSKRAAEQGIAELALSSKNPVPEGPRAPTSQYAQAEPDADGAGLTQEIERDEERLHRPQCETPSLLRPVFIRPGLMYHPHTRPLSTLPAALFDLTSTLHRKLPNLPFPLPFGFSNAAASPSRPFPTQPGAPQSYAHRSISSETPATLLTTPPLHVDTVARAVCAAVLDEKIQGPVGVQAIRTLAGWKDPDVARAMPA